MFLVRNFLINRNQFKDLIYHERNRRYMQNIELAHEKFQKVYCETLKTKISYLKITFRYFLSGVLK